MDAASNEKGIKVQEKFANTKKNGIFTIRGTEFDLNVAKPKISEAIKSFTERIRSEPLVTNFMDPFTSAAVKYLEPSGKGHAIINNVEQEFQVIISLPQISSTSETTNMIMSAMLGDIEVIVVCGDALTYDDCDILINPANSRLQHYGGVAKAIADSAGDEFVQMCDSIVPVDGFEDGTAVSTGAFGLKGVGKNERIKYIVHAVGPIYNG